MSKVVSTRLPEETEARLQRLARRLGKTTSETGAMLIEESLRQDEFALIEFRNSTVGRQAYLKNSNLAVWQVMRLAEEYDRDIDKIATHLQRVRTWVVAAFNYAEAYPEEIEWALKDAAAVNYSSLKQILPNIESISIPKQFLGEDTEK